MFGAALTTAGGFSVLNLSSLVPLQLFGQVIRGSDYLALISSIFVVPAMYAPFLEDAEIFSPLQNTEPSDSMDVFKGRITSSGFSSGDRIVIGIGRIQTWRILQTSCGPRKMEPKYYYSPSKEHAELVSSLYSFEEVRIVDVNVERSGKSIVVSAGDMQVKMSWGFTWPIPLWRPLGLLQRLKHSLEELILEPKLMG